MNSVKIDKTNTRKSIGLTLIHLNKATFATYRIVQRDHVLSRNDLHNGKYNNFFHFLMSLTYF